MTDETNIKKGNASLNALLKLCGMYEDDESYVYKLCSDKTKCFTGKIWLVVMQKLKDTKTNEIRENVVDKKFAKFRANKLKVILITNIYDPRITKESIINVYYKHIPMTIIRNDNDKKYIDVEEHTIKYEVGKIVVPDFFDEDVNSICSGGIHYFRTILPAYYYRMIPGNYTGHWIYWKDSGEKELEGEKLNGIWVRNSIKS